MSDDLNDWGPAPVLEAVAGPDPLPPALPTAPAMPAMRRRIGAGAKPLTLNFGDSPMGLGLNTNTGGGTGGLDIGGLVGGILTAAGGAVSAGLEYDLQRRQLEADARRGSADAAGVLEALNSLQSSLTPDSQAAPGGMSTGVLVVGGLIILMLGGGLIWAISKK